MSGRELDPDGTDGYHPQHPWEQAGHPQYLAPSERTRLNWPPAPAHPAGPYEAMQWRDLPARPRKPKTDRETFGPGYTYPPSHGPRGTAGDSGARRPWWHRLIH